MKYVAEDGTAFENEIACAKYEYEQNLAHSVNVFRIAGFKFELRKWLKERGLGLGFWAESDGDDTNGIYLYLTDDEKTTATIWSDLENS